MAVATTTMMAATTDLMVRCVWVAGLRSGRGGVKAAGVWRGSVIREGGGLCGGVEGRLHEWGVGGGCWGYGAATGLCECGTGR